ncbi:hypothetical protein [Gaiella sp.]|uniref:hypothetical protein n=1 Tax=Gaiella sp. TaxID=2663207 RepID=UPI003982DD5D
MGAEDITVGGEVVYLLAELQSAEQGPVHEIGSRARVLEADGDRLTLAVGYGRFEGIVTCSRTLVARQRRSISSRRTLRPNPWSTA